MTQAIRSNRTINAKTIKTTAMHVAVIAVMATAVVGCNRGIKPVVNDPVKLVQIAQPISVLQPVFSTDVGSKKASSKDPLDLQVGYANSQIVTASRGGDLIGFDNNLLYFHRLSQDSTLSLEECYGLYCYINSKYFKSKGYKK